MREKDKRKSRGGGEERERWRGEREEGEVSILHNGESFSLQIHYFTKQNYFFHSATCLLNKAQCVTETIGTLVGLVWGPVMVM